MLSHKIEPSAPGNQKHIATAGTRQPCPSPRALVSRVAVQFGYAVNGKREHPPPAAQLFQAVPPHPPTCTSHSCAGRRGGREGPEGWGSDSARGGEGGGQSRDDGNGGGRSCCWGRVLQEDHEQGVHPPRAAASWRRQGGGWAFAFLTLSSAKGGLLVSNPPPPPSRAHAVLSFVPAQGIKDHLAELIGSYIGSLGGVPVAHDDPRLEVGSGAISGDSP